MIPTLSLLASVFQNASDAILVIDKSGFVMEANPAAEQMTGYTVQELIGQVHLCEICKGIATCSEEVTCVDCFSKRFKLPSFEMLVKHKDGTESAVMASSSKIPGDLKADMVITLRDMSEQQRAERERFQRMMTNYVIQAQEEERKRISRDLHDGIGQALYSIMIGLKVLDTIELDDAIQAHLSEVQQMTVRTLEEVKSMAVELRPSSLDDLGLVPAIRSYCKRFEQTFGMEAMLKIVGSQRRYATQVETALYRICQEAMTNAAKYADIDSIRITLQDQEDVLELVVVDEGRGFDPDKLVAQGTGLGLFGMRERAQLLGGEMKVESTPGLGTTIHVKIPLNEKGEPLHVHSNFNRR